MTGEVAAGRAPDVVVEAGTAVRVATGAPLPPGADTVVQVELTTPLDGAGRAGARGRDAVGRAPASVLVHVALTAGTNVRRRGGDLRSGAVILAPGRALGPAEIALVAGAGVPVVEVHRRPRVAVISTGDELRPAGTDLGPAGIPDSNGPSLVALGAAAGADARHVGIAPDDLGTMTRMLAEAIGTADLVVVRVRICGGASSLGFSAARRYVAARCARAEGHRAAHGCSPSLPPHHPGTAAALGHVRQGLRLDGFIEGRNLI